MSQRLTSGLCCWKAEHTAAVEVDALEGGCPCSHIRGEPLPAILTAPLISPVRKHGVTVTEVDWELSTAGMLIGISFIVSAHQWPCPCSTEVLGLCACSQRLAHTSFYRSRGTQAPAPDPLTHQAHASVFILLMWSTFFSRGR